MKKLTTIALIALLTFCLLAGCTNQEATLPEDNVAPVASAAEPFDMEESEIRDLYLKLFAEKQKDENFISDVEAQIYEESNLYIRNRKDGFISSYDELYNESREYYHPIVLPGTDEVVVAYIDEHGQLCIYNASKDSHDYFRNIHVPEDTDFIDNRINYSVVYTDNHVQVWEFGQKEFEADVPSGSNYVGFSYWEGYLFRNGGDVYSVNFNEERIVNEEKPEEEPKIITTFVCEPIAHGVKEVIVADYKLNSDAWSQPLFLMNDGSIKAYCVWNGDMEAPRDDTCHLTIPQYEGGWK